MPPDGQTTRQLELFKAETSWFHIFRAMIESGDAAEMGGSAFLVYSVIKAHTNFATGYSFPSLDTVAEKSGLSKAQVKRCLVKLEDMGYLRKEKAGRRNVYTLREKVGITDVEGRPTAVATWDYLPGAVKEAVADLKNVLVTGDIEGAKVVNIDTLNVNVYIASEVKNADTIVQIDGGIGEVKDPSLRKFLEGVVDRRVRGVEGSE